MHTVKWTECPVWYCDISPRDVLLGAFSRGDTPPSHSWPDYARTVLPTEIWLRCPLTPNVQSQSNAQIISYTDVFHKKKYSKYY